ncbi:MAG: hypothetical protein ACJ8DJ_06105 [Gemmatimonadales bacterium]
MQWTIMNWCLGFLAGGSALLLAAGCGGGDKNPTGPGGGGNVASYNLVALGQAGLPADVKVEDCTNTRFYSGGLQVHEDGSWQIKLQVNDINYGDWGYKDEGQIEQDGSTLWFDSQVSGTSHEGTLDGPEIRIMYDWCENGMADVQLVFDR